MIYINYIILGNLMGNAFIFEVEEIDLCVWGDMLVGTIRGIYIQETFFMRYSNGVVDSGKEVTRYYGYETTFDMEHTS